MNSRASKIQSYLEFLAMNVKNPINFLANGFWVTESVENLEKKEKSNKNEQIHNLC